MQVAALLTSSLVALTGSLPGPRHIVTSAHVQFDLPGGLAYAKGDSEGVEAYTARDASRYVGVAVTQARKIEKCEASAAEAKVRPGRTAGGLTTCSISASGAAGAMVMLLVETPVGVVSITTLSRSKAEGAALAAGVADTIHVDPALAQRFRTGFDERLVGCFEYDPPTIPGMRAAKVRCFRADQTFTTTLLVQSHHEYRMLDAYSNDFAEQTRNGVWALRGNVLQLVHPDGGEEEWDVRFREGGGFVADGRYLWSWNGPVDDDTSELDAPEDEEGGAEEQ
jgi:hypothetical protein